MTISTAGLRRNPAVTLSERASQRWFSGDSVITTSATRKRRIPKSLAPLTYPLTTRDRIRWLQERNEVLNDHHYQWKSLERRLEDLGDTTEKRVSWMRNKIFSFWREDYNPNNRLQVERAGPRMDARWMFWQIMFALLPGFLIGCYCQFVGLPRMLEQNRQIHIEEQREKWGDTYREEDDEELARLSQEAMPFQTRVYNAIYDLSLYLWSNEIPEQRTATPFSTTTPAQLGVPEGTDVQSSQGHQSIPRPATPSGVVVQPVYDSEEARTIAELKSKLADLERRVDGKRQSTTEQQLPSVKHSRIHDRAMEERKEQARLTEVGINTAETDPARNNSQSTWQSLHEFYEASLRYYKVLSEMSQSRSQPHRPTDGDGKHENHKATNEGLAHRARDGAAATQVRAQEEQSSETEPKVEPSHLPQPTRKLSSNTIGSQKVGDMDAQSEEKGAPTRRWWQAWWPQPSGGR